MELYNIIFVLFSLFCITGANVIKDIQANGSQLVRTSDNNFALSAAAIKNAGLQAVSVNGNNVMAYGQNCQVLNALTEQQKALVASARSEMTALEDSSQNSNFRSFSVSLYSMIAGGASGWSFAQNLGQSQSSFSTNGFSASKYGVDNYSVSQSSMPENLVRVFKVTDKVTFVYLDGSVQMKPVECLTSEEQQYLQQLSAQMKQAEDEMRVQLQNMSKQIKQDIGRNTQNLNQNSQNMQQNMQLSLGNMLGNGFPFNSRPFLNEGYNQPAMNNMFQQQPYQAAMDYAPNYGSGQIFGYPAEYPHGSYNAFGNSFPFGPNNGLSGLGFPRNN